MKRIVILTISICLLLSFFSPSGFAESAQNGVSISESGDDLVLQYCIPKEIENVGSISLELFYDAALFSAEEIRAEPLSGVEAIAPEADRSGRIGMSWTDSECSIRVAAGQQLVEVSFKRLDHTVSTFYLTPRIEIVGGEMGMQYYTALSGVENTPLVYTFAEQTITQAAEGDEVPEMSGPRAAAEQETETDSQPAQEMTQENIEQREMDTTDLTEGSDEAENRLQESEWIPSNRSREIVVAILSTLVIVMLFVSLFAGKKRR